MNHNTLGLLGHNLKEIYDAALISPDQPIQLIAWNDKLYSIETSWMGRRIVSMDSMIRLFRTQENPAALIRTALRKTCQVFEDYKPILAAQLQVAEAALKNWLTEAGPVSAFIDTFVPIFQFQRATWPFFKLISHQNLKLKKFLQDKEAILYDVPLITRTARMIQVYRLVMHCGGNLPFRAFIQAMQTLKIDEENTRLIKRWIRDMRFYNTTIDNRLVCKGLTALVDFWNWDSGKNYQAADIEEHVMRFHEDYLKPDPKHLAWRDNLKKNPGSFPYKLGEQIQPKTEGFDNNVNFEVVHRPRWVVVIGQNRAVLRIRNHVRRDLFQFLYGLRPCQFIYVDPKGRYGITERLCPIQNPEPLFNTLAWLVDQRNTPVDLLFRHLGISPEGILLSIKNHGKGEFDYHALERLAYDYANGDVEKYCLIVKKTNLIYLPHARFYAEVIRKGLNQESIDLDKLIKFYTDDTIGGRDITAMDDVIYARGIYKEALKLGQSLPNPLGKKGQEILKKWWTTHCQAGRLWPTLKDNFKIKIV